LDDPRIRFQQRLGARCGLGAGSDRVGGTAGAAMVEGDTLGSEVGVICRRKTVARKGGLVVGEGISGGGASE
jgi:hypothetical protein